MPYKIYTYEDPYRLSETDFWEEISTLPHFCVTRTLVNGLKDVMHSDIKGLLCPLDDLINHENVYRGWTDNSSRRVHQYGALTAWFQQLLSEEKIDKNFRMSLWHNQTYFLDAIRLFIELGISSASFDGSKGNREQRLFAQALREMEQRELFCFPSSPSKEKLKATLVRLAEDEKADYQSKNSDHSRGKWYDRAIQNTSRQALTAVVVHGLHQFSPVQLRLLTEMDKMGITVIFLFNYQSRFSKIYSSWTDIYSCFDVEIHHDANIKEYQPATMPNPSNALAFALGDLCEGRCIAGDSQFKKWHRLYKDIQFLEFASITGYAHFVSDHFNDAQERCRLSRPVMEQYSGAVSHASVLRFMNEQVYTSNRDVHTRLKRYFPDCARDRHFLSYPIGQFISAIYKLWDYEKGEILIEPSALKECLSSNILKTERGEILLRTFCNLEILFDSISGFSQFRQVFASDYLACYDRVAGSSKDDPIYPLRQISIYNKYKVKRQDILTLIAAVEEINQIAACLFAQDNSREDFVSFGKHFQNLDDFLKRRELALATEEERALITALQLRLDRIKPSKSTFSGTFRDLRDGLNSYLKQKEDEDSADWIVKNFEQIDGDILQSRGQFERDMRDGQKVQKTYHFACLSDRDMNRSVSGLLPWPLTEDYLRQAYSPADLQYQVYYTSLCERNGFLRYALFYGLCYNYCNVRLSYVRQYDDHLTEPYAILSLLGFRPDKGFLEEMREPLEIYSTLKAVEPKQVRYDRYQMMDMFLCPYRYFLDYIVSGAPIVQGQFLYQKYYENILIEAVWKQISGKPLELAQGMLDNLIQNESARLSPYFGFWKATEIRDLEMRARNYLVHDILEKSPGNVVRQYAQTHMNIRRLFGKAYFKADISDGEPQHPYQVFEKLAVRKYPSKIYSLHKLPKADDRERAEPLLSAVNSFINQTGSRQSQAIPSDWCLYCVHRGNCMEPFLAEK